MQADHRRANRARAAGVGCLGRPGVLDGSIDGPVPGQVDGDKPKDTTPSSYDQITPVLLGKESFAGHDGQGQGRQGRRSWPARRSCWRSATT